jgi:hypothetical protein
MYRRIFSGLLAVVAVSMLLTGCDSFLQKKPQGELNSQNYFRNESDARKAVNAVYDYAQMRSSDFFPPYPMVFGSIASDNATKGGEGGSDQPSVGRVQSFTPRATDPYISSTWNTLYTGVYRANLAIKNIPNIESMSASAREQLVGEAKFLRAYFHFYLLKMYGLGDGRANDGPGIPLLTEPKPASESDVPRSPEPEVWSQIESDLKDAASSMSPTAPDLGRATSGAAKALRVKAHIFQEEWSDAKTLAEEIISSGRYRLAADYSRIFTQEGEFGPGSVFEINHEDISDALEGTVGTTYQNSRSTWGYGFNCPTQDLFEAFASNDPRRDATIITDGETLTDLDGDTETIEVQGACSANGPDGGYLNQKRWVHSDDQPSGPRKGPTNLRVIRYAQVLLWHAEAANEVGDFSAARTSLNKVRARARDDDNNPSNDPPGVLPDVTTNDQAELRQRIWREQRLELAMEYHRFFMLVRQDRAADRLADQGFQEGTHERFPIPQGQLDQSQVLEQNPNY